MKNAFEDARLQCRLLGAVLAFELCKDMFTYGLWAMVETSITNKVAQTSYPTVIAAIWIILSVLTIPYFLMQAFAIWEKHRSRLTRLACHSILASGVLLIYMGYLSKDLDFIYVTNLFLVSGAVCVGMAGVLANGLNSALRLRLEAKQRKEDAL